MRRTLAVATAAAVLSAAITILVNRPAHHRDAWRRVAPGVSHRAVALPGGIGAEGFRIDLHEAAIRVVDARESGGRASAWELRERVPGAVLAVNGGFFDEHGAPMGLVRTGGRETNPLRHADWGVFWVAGERAGIVHARAWHAHPEAGATEAIQAGPRLVVGGRAMKVKPQVARRTVVCVQRPSVVVLLVTEPIGAPRLARWLATPVDRGGLGCTDALNLDGGPSTQASLRAGDTSIEIAGGWPVPTGLVVVPRRGVGAAGGASADAGSRRP